MVSVDSWWDGLVRGRTKAVLELVLNAIADDYESVETILTSINEWDEGPSLESWTARSAVPVSRPEVTRALRELIREGYAEAYVLNSEKPYAHRVEFCEDEAADLWFYASPKGKAAVNKLEEQIAGNP